MRHPYLAFCVALFAFAALAGSPARSTAGTDVDLRAGLYSDMSAVTLGGGLLSSMGSSWYFNPNVEQAFGDGGSMTALSADFHRDFAPAGTLSPYLGGGPTLLYANPDRGESRTNLGLNLLGGISGLRGAVRPFAQIKAMLSENNELALMGGIRF